MAVPNTTSFTFQDVTTEIYGDTNAGRNLSSAFTDSDAAKFDPAYGSKTMSPKTLLGFRNYGAVTYYFSVDQDLFNLDNTAQDIYINITTNYTSLSMSVSEPTWSSVSPTTGSGDTMLTVHVDANPGPGDRVTFVSIDYGAGTKDCRINQAA